MSRGLAAATLAFMFACGSNESTPSANTVSASPAPTTAPLPIDWDAPLHGGTSVASPARAERYVLFRVRSPRFEIDPSLIQVDGEGVRPVDRIVAFVYEFPGIGNVLVEQRVPQFTPAEFRARADAPGVPKDAITMIDLRGTRALLISAHGIGRVMWIEHGVLFDITGPSVSPSEVVDLAKQV